ncbi:MAG TPA: NYN domain-containing protein, partial [Anaerolineales bacterium]|nr:NYN domain-containing protein [Anaerolineales bacterium]
GIDPKFMPMPQSGANEKGADVALAIDAMQVGLEGHLDVAVLVTGDADFVPLVRALMKQGVSVVAAYFEYQEGEHKSFINERLLNVCNYVLNINDMETDKDFKAIFKSLFRKGDEIKASKD